MNKPAVPRRADSRKGKKSINSTKPNMISSTLTNPTITSTSTTFSIEPNTQSNTNEIKSSEIEKSPDLSNSRNTLSNTIPVIFNKPNKVKQQDISQNTRQRVETNIFKKKPNWFLKESRIDKHHLFDFTDLGRKRNFFDFKLAINENPLAVLNDNKLNELMRKKIINQGLNEIFEPNQPQIRTRDHPFKYSNFFNKPESNFIFDNLDDNIYTNDQKLETEGSIFIIFL